MIDAILNIVSACVSVSVCTETQKGKLSLLLSQIGAISTKTSQNIAERERERGEREREEREREVRERDF